MRYHTRWSFTLHFVFIATLFAAITSLPSSQSTHAHNPAALALSTGTVSGQVTGPDGIPLANIPVNLEGQGYSDGVCTTPEGAFSFQQVPLDLSLQIQANPVGTNGCDGSHTYAVSWWDQKPMRDSADSFMLSAASPDRAGIHFSLAPGGGASGHIYLADGTTPVEGVCVAFTSVAHTGSPAHNWGKTGPDGSFTIWNLPTETFYIVLNAQCNGLNPTLINEWYAPGASVFDAKDAGAVTIVAGQLQTGLDFQLDSGGTIAGKVMDSGGAGLPGIAVMLDGPSYGKGVCTADDGSYAFTNAEFNVGWRVRVNSYDSSWCGGSHTSYAYQFWDHVMTREAWGTITITEQQDTRTGIDFNLDPGGGISGHIYQQDGITPVANACLRFATSIENVNFIEGWSTATGEDGSFIIWHLPAGPLYVQSHKSCQGQHTGLVDEWYAPGGSGSMFDAQPVMITAGQLAPNVDFQLDPSGSIAGQVTGDGGAPLANIQVSIINLLAYNTCTDSNGNYALQSVPLNFPAILVASNKDWSMCTDSIDYVEQFWNNKPTQELADPIVLTLAERDKTNANFALRLASAISGHVYRQDGITPVEDACIEVFFPDLWDSFRYWSSTGADGSYHIKGLPEAAYYVRTSVNCNGSSPYLLDEFYAPGGSVWDEAQAAQVVTTGGQVTANVDFQLDAAGAVAGQVSKAADLAPLDGVLVVITDLDNRWVNMAYSTAQGSYEINGLPPGSYKVFARDSNQPPAYVLTYYNQKGDSAAANLVHITGGQATTGIDFQLQATLQTTVTPDGSIFNGYTVLGPKISVTVPPGAVSDTIQMLFSPTSELFGPRGFTFDLQ